TAKREQAQPFVLTELADLLIRRAVVLASSTTGRAGDPLAGLKVDDADVARLVIELAGPAAAPPARTVRAIAALDTAIGGARARLAQGRTGMFAGIVAGAQLDPLEAEVLSVLVAVELDPRRQRLVGYLNDDITLRRCTAFTLRELFGPASEAELAVAPG